MKSSMFGALALPLPSPAAAPAGPSSISSAPPRAGKTQMPLRCLVTSHAPLLAEIDTPSSYASRRPLASLYEVLRVKRTATPAEIKASYRALAKLNHPDATGGPLSDGRDFIKIHNAYATLSDPGARALYDLSLGQMRRSPGTGSGFYPTRRWETDQCW